jgi:hypothetical protein
MKLLSFCILMVTIVISNSAQSMDSLSESSKARLGALLPGFGAYGFSLTGPSANPNVLFANESAVIFRYSELLNYLVASYEFDPTDSRMNDLRSEYTNIKVILLKHSLESNDTVESLGNIPNWLNAFGNAESLIMYDVDIDSSPIINCAKLKVLGLVNTQRIDVKRLVENIEKLPELEFFIHRAHLTKQDLEHLRQKFPNLIVYNAK